MHCAPVDPHRLWEASKHHLCDDLACQLTRTFHIVEPNQDQIYDYGLHLIDQELKRHGKSLEDYPTMPRPQNDWGQIRGNQLIFEQRNYNREEQQEHVDRGLPTLNPQQITLYDAIMDSVLNSHGSSFFLHSGSGCGKTYLAKLISAGVHARDKIVLCVASTGLAALLLPGGCTAHSRFKIPIPIHELLKETSLIIWMRQPLSIISLWKAWIVLFVTCWISQIAHLEELPFYLVEISGKHFLLSYTDQENNLSQPLSHTPIFGQG